MDAEYEYIEIKEAQQKPKRKTKVFKILSKKHGDTLGLIRWWASWRQYCFFPNSITVWNDGCLQNILEFLKKLKEERKTK